MTAFFTTLLTLVIVFFLLCMARYITLLFLDSFNRFVKGKPAGYYDIFSYLQPLRKEASRFLDKKIHLKYEDFYFDIYKKKSRHKPEDHLSSLLDEHYNNNNFFHQLLYLDQHFYNEVKKLTGKSLDRISNLSQNLSYYKNNKEHIKNNILKKISAHESPKPVDAYFKHSSIHMDWQDWVHQSQLGWLDVLIGNNPLSVQLTKNTNYVINQLKKHPKIPVHLSLDNPDFVDFYFDPTHGIKNLTSFLKENPNNVKIGNNKFSSTGIAQGVKESSDFLSGGAGFINFPLITMALSGVREFHLLKKQHTDLKSAIKNWSLDVAGVGGGAALGATIGTSLLPGIGTIAGSVLMAMYGKFISNDIKEESLNHALEGMKEITNKLKKLSSSIEKKYNTSFNQDKLKEQNKITKMAAKSKQLILDEVEQLVKWRIRQEKINQPFEMTAATELNHTIRKLNAKIKSHWIRYLWPKRIFIRNKRKIKKIMRIKKQLLNHKFKDRGVFFQLLALNGLCKKYVLSEMQNMETNRINFERSLLKKIYDSQNQLLIKRLKSIDLLISRASYYTQHIRMETLPYLEKVRDHKKIVVAEAKKLGLLKTTKNTKKEAS